MKRVLENAECDEIRNLIFLVQRIQKARELCSLMKYCVVYYALNSDVSYIIMLARVYRSRGGFVTSWRLIMSQFVSARTCLAPSQSTVTDSSDVA